MELNQQEINLIKTEMNKILVDDMFDTSTRMIANNIITKLEKYEDNI